MLVGTIIEKGRKKELLAPPHHEYTDKLLASIPEMDPDWLDKLLAERTSIYLRNPSDAGNRKKVALSEV